MPNIKIQKHLDFVCSGFDKYISKFAFIQHNFGFLINTSLLTTKTFVLRLSVVKVHKQIRDYTLVHKIKHELKRSNYINACNLKAIYNPRMNIYISPRCFCLQSVQ